MTLDEFHRIVDDAQEYLMLLILWDWGEPFLNPELPEMITYAAERDIRTVTSTNAQFLGDESYLTRILGLGPVDADRRDRLARRGELPRLPQARRPAAGHRRPRATRGA